MAWTSPRTYTTGELITAAIMNTHVRDNFNALKTPPGGFVSDTADQTTTSSAFVDIVNQTLTFTTTGGDILAMFVGGFENASVANLNLQFDIDGAGTGAIGFDNNVDTSAGRLTSATLLYRWEGESAASHTIKVQWKTSTPTMSLANTQIASAFYAGEVT